MKSLQKKLGVAIAIVGLVLGAAASASAGGLVGMLTRQLGVSNEQAEGGAGALFSHAKQKLSPAEYDKVSDAVPEASTLLDAAPKPEAGGGMMGGISSALGGGGTGMGSAVKSAGEMSTLAKSFSSLGMSPDMMRKFTPIILEYAQSKGGDTVMNLLKGALM